MMRALIIAVVVVIAAPAVAMAEERRSVAIASVEGPAADAVRGAIEDALRARPDVALGEPDAAARVRATVSGRGKRWRASVRLEVDGEVVASHRFRARSKRALVRGIEKTFARRFGDALAALPRDRAPAARDQAAGRETAPAGREAAPEREAAPAEPGDLPAGAERESARAAAEPASGGGDAALSARVSGPERPAGTGDAVRVQLGVGVMAREFRYRDDIFEALTAYELAAAPALVVHTEWYPLAHRSRGWPAMLGVALDYEVMLPGNTVDADGGEFPTEASAWTAAVIARHRFGRASAGAYAGFGQRSFTIRDADDGSERPEIPNVSYRELGAGGTLESPIFGPLSAELRGAYLLVLDAGEIDSMPWFPRSAASGVSATAALRWHLGAGLAATAGASLHRHGFTLDPVPGDDRVAGGALDQVLVGTLGIAYTGE